MSLSAASSWGTEPTNPTTLATMNAFVKSQTIVLSGTVGESDIEDGSVTYEKTVPGPHFYADGLKFGSAGSEYYIVTLPVKPTALVAGLRFYWLADQTNTGDTVKLRVSASPSGSLTDKLLKTEDGQDILAGQLRAGSVNAVVYDGTYFKLISPVPRPVRLYVGTAGGTVNAITGTVTLPNTTTLADLQNVEIEFIAAGINTGATTFQVVFSGGGSLAATAIKKKGTTALSGYEIYTGQICRVVYDGTSFQLTSVRSGNGAAMRDRVFRLSVNGAGDDVTVAADQLVVNSITDALMSSGQVDGADSVLLRNVSLSLDITASGANGLDTGAVTNADYYVWVLYNSATGAVCGIFSRNAPRLASGYELHPTMPSGYTHAACVSACRRVAGSILSYSQTDKVVSLAYQAFGPFAPGWTGINLGASLPSYLVKSVSGFVASTTGTTFRANLAAVYDGANYLGIIQVGGVTHGTTNFGTFSAYCSIPFSGLAVDMRSTPGGWVNAEAGTVYVVVTGFELE